MLGGVVGFGAWPAFFSSTDGGVITQRTKLTAAPTKVRACARPHPPAFAYHARHGVPTLALVYALRALVCWRQVQLLLRIYEQNTRGGDAPLQHTTRALAYWLDPLAHNIPGHACWLANSSWGC